MQLHFTQNMFAGFNDRDEKIFERWFKSYYPGIVKRVRQKTHNSPDAEDVACLVIIAIYKSKDPFLSIRSIENFLDTVIDRECVKYLKKKERWENKLEIITEHMLKQEKEAMKAAETRHLFKQLENLATQMLPPQCREVFRLCYHESLKNWEIAERLGISEKTVEYHKSFAYKKLRIGIMNQYGGREMFLIIISFPLFIIYLLMQKLFL